MPTESLERRKQTLDKDDGEMAASTAATDHLASNSTLPRRSRTPSGTSTNAYGTAPSAHIDHLNSNGTTLRKVRTSKSFRAGENPPPSSTQSRRQSLERRVKDVAALHTELSKHSTRSSGEEAERTPALHFYGDKNTDSWVNSLRKPAAAKTTGTSSRNLEPHENVTPRASASASSSEEKDLESVASSQKDADGTESSSKSGKPGVKSRSITSDGKVDGQKTDMYDTKKRHRRSSSISRREDLAVASNRTSNRDNDTSPPPNPDSRPEVSSRSTSTRTKRNGSSRHQRSNGVESRKAASEENASASRSTSVSRKEDFTSHSNLDRGQSPAQIRQSSSSSRPQWSNTSASNTKVRSESARLERSNGKHYRTAAVKEKENGSRTMSTSALRTENVTNQVNHDRGTSAAPNHPLSSSLGAFLTSGVEIALKRSNSMDSRRDAVKEPGSGTTSNSVSTAKDMTSQVNREKAPAPAPDHRPSKAASRPELSDSFTSNRKLPSEHARVKRSNSMDSRIAALREHGSRTKPASVSRAEDFISQLSRNNRAPSEARRRLNTPLSRPELSDSLMSDRKVSSESAHVRRSTRMDYRIVAARENGSFRREWGDFLTSGTEVHDESARIKRSNTMDSRRAAAVENAGENTSVLRSTSASKTVEDLTIETNWDRASSSGPDRGPSTVLSRPELNHSITSKIRSRSESATRKISNSINSRRAALKETGSSTSSTSASRTDDFTNQSNGGVKGPSSSMESRTAALISQGRDSIDPNNISLREQYQSKAKSRSIGKPKGDASYSARTRLRPGDTAGNLKDEEDAAADFQNLRRTERSTSGRSRQEHAFDDKPDTLRRRTISSGKILKEIDASNFSVTKQRSSGNSEEDGIYSAGSTREWRTDKWKQDAPKRQYSRKYKPATNVSVQLPLNKVAAASYNGGWLPFGEMMPFPDDIANLNKFLDDCRNDLEAGVPGKVLIAVLGKENSDLDSLVSTIAYAYFLSCKANDELLYIAPVINMREADFVLHTDAVWLFKASGVDTSKFIFVDQISLLYYHKFSCLNLVLVDHSKLASHQENLQDAVVAIIDHNVPGNLYPWVSNVEIEQVGSCCTLIAEKYASDAPQLLTGRGISRLLLGAIILDTANLDSKFSRFTTRDEEMAAVLINGAGRYGLQGLFRHLRKMKFDISILKTKDVLRKDLKQFTLGPGKTDTHESKGAPTSAAMSSVGVSLVELLGRTHIVEDLTRFRRRMKLNLLLVMTGYYDASDRYHREILIVPEDIKLAQQVVVCFKQRKDELLLSAYRANALPEEMLVFKQGQVTASRKAIRDILIDHFAQ